MSSYSLHQLVKLLFFILVLGGIVFAIGYYLGYWKEDVWKNDSHGDPQVDIKNLDNFF